MASSRTQRPLARNFPSRNFLARGTSSSERCSMMTGMFGCFSRQPLEIEIVVQRAEAGRRQLDLADAAEGMALQRVVVADVGMLLGLVARPSA